MALFTAAPNWKQLRCPSGGNWIKKQTHTHTVCIPAMEQYSATKRTHLWMWMCACSVAQSCPALCDSVDCNPPGSSVHGILQARILEWVGYFLLQGIFPNQGSNPCLLHLLYWQVDSLPLYHLGSPVLSITNVLGRMSNLKWLLPESLSLDRIPVAFCLSAGLSKISK